MLLSPSRIYTLTAIVGFLALLTALLSQHGLGMRPCAWCVFQRLVLIGVILTSCVAAMFSSHHRIWPARLAGALAFCMSASGVLAAWYQYTVAAMQFSCAQTFADRFMSDTGLDAAVPWLFGIYATCMDARVDFFGLEYALWALALFVLTALACLLALWRSWR